jgi:sigma-B regulation protein RsbU (phosphoserine phosphatase)
MKAFTETPRPQHHNPFTLTQLLRIPSFHYAGLSRPTKEISANFLESASRADGKVVLALGDTDGSFNPLPALCIRHYFRRSLPLESTDPNLVAEAMSGLIYDCCAEDSFLTCFYAEYSRNSGVLRYVNAGHEVPLLIRTNPDQVVRLDRGGPVLGLLEAPHYNLGDIHLRPGDRLVAFTSGVIEALAAQTGRSAENSLISLARQHANTTPAQLARLIVAACDASSNAQTDCSVFVAQVDQQPSNEIELEESAALAVA